MHSAAPASPLLPRRPHFLSSYYFPPSLLYVLTFVPHYTTASWFHFIFNSKDCSAEACMMANSDRDTLPNV